MGSRWTFKIPWWNWNWRRLVRIIIHRIYSTTHSAGRLNNNLVTSKIVTTEMTSTMTNLTNISFSMVESQIFWVYTGGTWSIWSFSWFILMNDFVFWQGFFGNFRKKLISGSSWKSISKVKKSFNENNFFVWFWTDKKIPNRLFVNNENF